MVTIPTEDSSAVFYLESWYSLFGSLCPDLSCRIIRHLRILRDEFWNDLRGTYLHHKRQISLRKVLGPTQQKDRDRIRIKTHYRQPQVIDFDYYSRTKNPLGEWFIYSELWKSDSEKYGWIVLRPSYEWEIKCQIFSFLSILF